MLKLAALDAEDLAVLSAHMQDALVKAGDLAFSRSRRQFALVANRFAWDADEDRQRRRSGLHFDRVLSVRSRGIPRHDADAVLSLLSIGFEMGDAPAGDVVLTFSGGGNIRLTVECIEAQLRDLGPVWQVSSVPSHDDTDGKAP
jgi:hypothetical protein